MASAFEDPASVRKAIRDATKAIRARLRHILTADERLRLITDIRLDALDRAAGTITRHGAGLLTVAAEFLHLVAELLGYDWLRGRPNREVIYFQTAEQQFLDDAQRHPTTAYPPEKIEYSHRAAIAKDLLAKGLRVAQIARVLNLPETVAKDILVREGALSRASNIKKS